MTPTALFLVLTLIAPDGTERVVTVEPPLPAVQCQVMKDLIAQEWLATHPAMRGYVVKAGAAKCGKKRETSA